MLAASALIWMLWLGADPSASEPKSSEPTVSANGAHSVRMVEIGPGQCRVEMSRESQVVWELEKCVGTIHDLYFPSEDGNRFWVLYPLPEKPARAKNKQMVPWYSVTVAGLYTKEGQLVRSRRLIDLINTGPGRLKVEQLERHFKWLEGVVGVKGKSPRVNQKNEVEFETIDRRTLKLEF